MNIWTQYLLGSFVTLGLLGALTPSALAQNYDLSINVVGFSDKKVYVDVTNHGPEASRPGYIWLAGSVDGKVRTPGQFSKQLSCPGLSPNNKTRIVVDATALVNSNPGAQFAFKASIPSDYDRNAKGNHSDQHFCYPELGCKPQ